MKTSRVWTTWGQPGGRNCRRDPWLRSLCVNTVTAVRFILWGWRRADGPIAEAELLKGGDLWLRKDRKKYSPGNINGLTVPRCFWVLTHGQFFLKCLFLSSQMVYNPRLNNLQLLPYVKLAFSYAAELLSFKKCMLAQTFFQWISHCTKNYLL